MVQITRKQLEEYRKKIREIRLLEYELKDLDEADRFVGNSVILNGKNGTKKPESVVGFDYDRYEKRKYIVDRKREEAAKIRKWVDEIEDDQTRCVFHMFYIDGMSWKKIADRIGVRGNEDYPRLMIRDAYLKKCGIK